MSKRDLNALKSTAGGPTTKRGRGLSESSFASDATAATNKESKLPRPSPRPVRASKAPVEESDSVEEADRWEKEAVDEPSAADDSELNIAKGAIDLNYRAREIDGFLAILGARLGPRRGRARGMCGEGGCTCTRGMRRARVFYGAEHGAPATLGACLPAPTSLRSCFLAQPLRHGPLQCVGALRPRNKYLTTNPPIRRYPTHPPRFLARPWAF